MAARTNETSAKLAAVPAAPHFRFLLASHLSLLYLYNNLAAFVSVALQRPLTRPALTLWQQGAPAEQVVQSAGYQPGSLTRSSFPLQRDKSTHKEKKKKTPQNLPTNTMNFNWNSLGGSMEPPALLSQSVSQRKHLQSFLYSLAKTNKIKIQTDSKVDIYNQIRADGTATPTRPLRPRPPGGQFSSWSSGCRRQEMKKHSSGD